VATGWPARAVGRRTDLRANRPTLSHLPRLASQPPARQLLGRLRRAPARAGRRPSAPRRDRSHARRRAARGADRRGQRPRQLVPPRRGDGGGAAVAGPGARARAPGAGPEGDGARVSAAATVAVLAARRPGALAPRRRPRGARRRLARGGAIGVARASGSAETTA